MRIIYVENVRIPSERAHAYQIVQACAWFARQGHEVVLVNPDRACGRDVFAEYGIEPALFRHVTLHVTDPLSWPWFPWKKIAYAWQRSSFAKALTTWAGDQRADIWYTRDPAMVDILRDPSRRFVLELHDRPDSQPSRWERIKPFVDRYIVITKGLKETLVGLGVEPSRISVAHDGYDPKDFEKKGDRPVERDRLGIPQDAFVAIYTGSLYPWKGMDLVVRAWSKTEDAHLVIIGGPEGDRRRIEALVDPATAPRIHIVPTLPHANAVNALAAGDVGLLTSSPNHEIGRLYTSPLKQFEYLAAGLPIVASDVPSSHEILNDDVAKFYPFAEDGFAETLMQAKNLLWRENASSAARALAKPYTWEARTRSILTFLQES